VTQSLYTTILNYEIIDFDLNLSDHLPFLTSFEFNIVKQITPTEADPADDPLGQNINNVRLIWDRADYSSYYNATNDYLHLTNSSYDVLNMPVMCDNFMCHGKCKLGRDKRGAVSLVTKEAWLIDRCYKVLVNLLT